MNIKYDIKESCQDMICSILAYQFSDKPEDNIDNEYLKQYVDKLGRNIVLDMMEKTISKIDHIKYGVATDSEGCVYNSIVWKE